jgi:hypothetical protein
MYLVAARLVAAPIEQSGEGGSTNLSRIDGLETGSKFWKTCTRGSVRPELEDRLCTSEREAKYHVSRTRSPHSARGVDPV